MGQEIDHSRFGADDFRRFRDRLVAETALLEYWLAEGALECDQPMAGCELEAWLVDTRGRPAPINQPFLEALDDPLVVPELATFNVELNTHPHGLGPGLFEALHRELSDRWRHAQATAHPLGARMLMIGILPTVTKADLCLANISGLRRYQALNEQVLRMREGAPLTLDIQGRDHLRTQHHDVMLEAATTSFQLHLKIAASQGGRAFNLAKMVSAPMVALSANSPFLFGHELWDETRIPLFEQSVAVGASDYSQRVTFGIRYVEENIIECFQANRDRYPVLLPQLMDQPVEKLAHLRLHNGTIWRWNRPLIGFDDDGRPHLRIEHRVVPSGPTPLDLVANAAFFFGLVHALLTEEEAPEARLPFAVAKENFYRAARHGLDAPITWFDGRQGSLAELCRRRLLPQARRGLLAMGLEAAEVEPWLAILAERIASGQTGARWQRRWVAEHGRDFGALTLAYWERQESGLPVHRWSL